MSYCRFSSDDWRCDLYCYEDASGGWTTHVAGGRCSEEIPRLDWSKLGNDPEEFARQYRAQLDLVTKAEPVPIGLPYDGQTFRDYTLEAFRARIVMLRETGYNCPDKVLERIDEELRERDAVVL